MVPGIRAPNLRRPRYGSVGQRRASFPEGRGLRKMSASWHSRCRAATYIEDRHWRIWMQRGPFPVSVDSARTARSAQVVSYGVAPRGKPCELTFSLAMVLMTSSGGVPSSSVMMENWLTSDDGERSPWVRHFAAHDPSLGTTACPPAFLQRYSLCSRCPLRVESASCLRRHDRDSPATSYFCHVNMISGAR